MGCGGSKNGGAFIEVDSDEFKEAEVGFVWPDKECDKMSIEYGGAGLRDLIKPMKTVQYAKPKPGADDQLDFPCKVTLKPGSYRTRWIKDGRVRWLTPKEIAPTLLRKILEHEKVKPIVSRLKFAFPPERDPQIADLPDGKLKDGLAMLEGLLPTNKWRIKGTVEEAYGVYEKGELIQGKMEQLKDKKRKFMKDPRTQIMAARMKKKAAIMAMKKIFETIGISLDDILGNIGELLGIDMPEADLDAKIAEMDCDLLEPLSDEEKKKLSTMTPEFKSTAIARFCVATPNTKVPTVFTWAEVCEKAVLRYWPIKTDADGKFIQPTNVEEVDMVKRIDRKARRKARKQAEKAAKAAEKNGENVEAKADEETPVEAVNDDGKWAEPREEANDGEAADAEEDAGDDADPKKKKKELFGFEAVVGLPVGRYAYQYVIDGETFYKPGKPLPSEADSPYDSFRALEVSAVSLIY